jgi:hypothetical protein
VVVYGITPCAQASPTVTPPMSIDPGTCSTSSGWVSPISIAVAAVMILFTDPGSKGEVTDRLPISRFSCLPRSWEGSNVLSFDMASTSPVFASSTTADTFLAPERFFACCTCCCT